MAKIISQLFGPKKAKFKTYRYDDEGGGDSDSDICLSPLQNRYLGDEVAEEPDFEYVPESSLVGGIGSSLVAGGAAHQTSLTCSQGIIGHHSGGGGQALALSQSMLLLEESLTSGAIVGQFEPLYRR